MTQTDIKKALERLAILQFWPADPAARKGIGLLLERIVDRKERLEWLVETMINHVGSWQGPKELRGVYCTHYRPADGIEADCITTHGFTPIDCEQNYLNEAEHLQEKRLTQGEFLDRIKRIQ